MPYAHTQEIREIDGTLTLCVTAYRRVQGKSYELEFYRRTTEGKFARNLYTNCMSGYVVRFPGLKYGYYREDAELENWAQIPDRFHPYFCDECPTATEKAIVDKHFPGMRYVLAKCDLTYEEVFDIIPLWKKNPKVELLLAAGFRKLAFSKQFSKFKPDTQKKYLKALKNCEGQDPSLEQIRFMNEGWTLNQYRISRHWRFHDYQQKTYKCNLETAKYIEKNAIDPAEYCDYRAMVTKCGHDLADQYWSFPTDFKKAHAKVIRQSKNIDRMANEKALAAIQEGYAKKVKKLIDKVTETEGLKVFVPKLAKEFNHHAKVLHQCLVTCNYAQQVSDGKCVLVFITKNGKPYATAELKRGRGKFKIGQFYGDENKRDYEAKEDAKNALNEWAKEFNIKIAA